MIIDISLPLGPDTPVWPGDPPVLVEAVARIEDGDPADVSRLALGTHTGTHVDPPAHFLPGAATVDHLPLEVLVGPAVVLDCSAGPIDGAALEARPLPDGSTRVLLKTGGDAGALTPDGARWLVERGVRLVGADTLSIEPETGDYPVHRLLLGAGVVIVEGLDLAAVAAGAYQFVCLPLRIVDGDGAPARAVLITS
ncbi:MAG TPA: cyclase family protein [Acidimicrobiia bacterium]|nr:cyclase family protein [Acidimicrobiia bacterium]